MKVHLRFERIVVLICVLALIVLAVLANQTAATRPIKVLMVTPTATPTPKPNKYIYAYYAPPWEFCIGRTTNAIVQSDGSYESNLVGGSISYPIPDTDYMQPRGQQEHTCLPGTKYDHYYFLGTSFVLGSGCIKEYSTENGGRFALLHMNCDYNKLTPPSFAVIPPTQPTAGPIYTFAEGAKKFRDESYQDIPAMPNKGVAAVQHGGQYVGYSRWPSSLQYSFWSCYDDISCENDAHLCVVADGLALQWFQRVERGLDHHAPKTPTFHLKIWNAYRAGRHLPLISPYTKKGGLIWAASVWRSHQGLRGIKARGHYYGNARTGYTQTPFRYGVIRCWNLYKKCKVSKK